MSDHLSLSIERTKEAIRRHERMLDSYPSKSGELALESLRRMLRKLEAERASLAAPLTSTESVTSLPESNCIPPNQL
jgi:hypothetical protein